MYDKNLFGKNLKYLRNKYNVEQQELAEELGRKSGSTISDWERGKATPNAGTLSYIAKKFNVSLKNLMETDLSEYVKEEVVSTPQLVPILGEVAASNPDYTIEDIEGYMTLPPDKRSTDGLFYLRVKSDSMDKIFPVGSYVLVDSKAKIENGDIAIFKPNGDEATLKRVKFQDHFLLLVPESNNNNHDPIILEMDKYMQSGEGLENARFIGKVVGMYMSV